MPIRSFVDLQGWSTEARQSIASVKRGSQKRFWEVSQTNWLVVSVLFIFNPSWDGDPKCHPSTK